jgi:undecaprenyl-diphosphatase
MGTFSLLIIRKRFYSIFIILWAFLVSYSSIYLGVHYPGDILGGATFGIILGFLIYRLYLLIEAKLDAYYKKS